MTCFKELFQFYSCNVHNVTLLYNHYEILKSRYKEEKAVEQKSDEEKRGATAFESSLPDAPNLECAPSQASDSSVDTRQESATAERDGIPLCQAAPQESPDESADAPIHPQAAPFTTAQQTDAPIHLHAATYSPLEQPDAPVFHAAHQQLHHPPLPYHSQSEPQHGAFTHEGLGNDVQNIHGERSREVEWSYRQRNGIRHNEWSVPSYSKMQETPQNMYTPGICVNQPYSRKRPTDHELASGASERGSKRGGFLRAACLVLACVLLSGVATYGVMEYRFSRGDFPVVNQVVLGGESPRQGSGLTTPVSATGGGMPAEDIYDMARTHVVGIKTEMQTTGSFFGTQSSATSVSGSGFIISSDGYILTNYHVIETAHVNNLPIYIYLSDGTEYEAKVIGYESSNDFAVIKIDAAGLNPAVIGNSDSIRVGQVVYAVGNPFGDLVYTMTEGIVSALDRVVTVERKSINTFQFSAAVNSGNSGGPIYDINGEVIGIVTAKLMRGSVEGIGFAIPINDAIEIAAELIEHGYITGRPLIGITAQTVTSGHAEYYGWVEGAYVRSVAQDSAAEKAGLMVGDIIVALGDAEVDSMESLVFALRRHKAGDTLMLTVWRSGSEIELPITFDEDLAAGQPRRTQPQQTPTPQPRFDQVYPEPTPQPRFEVFPEPTPQPRFEQVFPEP